MRVCRQLHIMEVADCHVGIYSPFGHGMAFLPLPFWVTVQRGQYSQLPSPVVAYLRGQNILVETGFEDRWLSANAPSDAVRFNSMYLITTFACNLRCRYCVVLGTQELAAHSDTMMSTEIGLSALRSFRSHLDRHKPKEARITFYGGEPLLNKSLLFSLIPEIARMRYDSSNPKAIQTVIITNGYHFDPALIPLLEEHAVGVCVSIDGFQRNHDEARIGLSGGAQSHAEAVSSFIKYRDAGLSVGISTTVGKHNVSELPQIGEYFFRDLGARFIEFQLPYHPSQGKNHFWVASEDAAPSVLETYSLLESLGGIEGMVHRRISDFRSSRIRFRDCGASAAQLVVLPDGKIGPCHSLSNTSRFFGGDIRRDARIEDLPAFREWAKRHPFNMPECLTCPYVCLCGGGCTYNALMANGSIWTRDPQICPFMKQFVDWLLKRTWEDQSIEKVSIQTSRDDLGIRLTDTPANQRMRADSAEPRR